MHFLSNEEKDNWIGDSVDRETSVARKGVEDTETAIEQEQEDMGNAEKAGLTTTKPVTTFEEMLNAIGVSLSDLASSEDREDGEVENDDDDDPDLGRLSVDDEPSWVMGTIPKTVQHRMERVRQKLMTIPKWMQPHWGDVANYVRERDTKYGMAELKFQGGVEPQTEDDATASAPTTFGKHLENFDSVLG